MALRGFITGFLVIAILLAPARAEEELPGGFPSAFPNLLLAPPYPVVNVAVPGFGDRVGGGDYGLANVEPVEVGWSVQRGQREIRIFRTTQELRLSRRREARFQVRVGEVGAVYFWIESPPMHGAWKLHLSALHPDGYWERVYGENLDRERLSFVLVPPRALLEFRVSTKEQKVSRGFTFTVSPVRLSFWKDFRPLPSTRGLIK